MTDDDLHVGVVDAHDAGVPADPKLVTEILGWDFVVSAREFDVAVAMDDALSFLEVVKSFSG